MYSHAAKLQVQLYAQCTKKTPAILYVISMPLRGGSSFLALPTRVWYFEGLGLRLAHLHEGSRGGRGSKNLSILETPGIFHRNYNTMMAERGFWHALNRPLNPPTASSSCTRCSLRRHLENSSGQRTDELAATTLPRMRCWTQKHSPKLENPSPLVRDRLFLQTPVG